MSLFHLNWGFFSARSQENFWIWKSEKICWKNIFEKKTPSSIFNKVGGQKKCRWQPDVSYLTQLRLGKKRQKYQLSVTGCIKMKEGNEFRKWHALKIYLGDIRLLKMKALTDGKYRKERKNQNLASILFRVSNLYLGTIGTFSRVRFLFHLNPLEWSRSKWELSYRTKQVYCYKKRSGLLWMQRGFNWKK